MPAEYECYDEYIIKAWFILQIEPKHYQDGILLKFDHPIYENDTSPFFKGWNPLDFSILD
jgi:hypothetical protein